MIETFLKVLPVSLAGAVNPLGILIIFYLMAGKDRPITRTWVFLLGSTTVLIVLLLIAQPLLKHTLGVSSHQNSISAGIDIGLGVILLILAIFMREKGKKTVEATGSLRRTFAEGFLFMLILDIETLIFYLAAVKMVFDAHLPISESIVLFAVNILIVMSTMALPVLLATLMPKKSAKLLERLNAFITRHGQLIGKIVIIVIALYLIYDGVRYFI